MRNRPYRRTHVSLIILMSSGLSLELPDAFTDLVINLQHAGHAERHGKAEWHRFIDRWTGVGFSLHRQSQIHAGRYNCGLFAAPASCEDRSTVGLIAVRLVTMRSHAQMF